MLDHIILTVLSDLCAAHAVVRGRIQPTQPTVTCVSPAAFTKSVVRLEIPAQI